MSAKNIVITIPEPCSEKWNTMAAVDDLHRHCQVCDRVLTDFSKMSDDELALWFLHSKGKVCGQFSASQLGRKISVPAEKVKAAGGWRRGIAALWMLPLSLIGKNISAQTDTSVQVVQQVASEKTSVKIQGIVTDGETGKPLAAVRIALAGTKFFSTDSTGRFCFSAEIHSDTTTTLTASFGVEYETAFIKIDPEMISAELSIALQKAPKPSTVQTSYIQKGGVATIYINKTSTEKNSFERFFSNIRITFPFR